MALPLSLMPRSTRGVGALQDPGIHGTTRDPLTRRRKSRTKLRKDIEEYHLAYGIDYEEKDIDTFISRRPDGLAFDNKKKICGFLEYTRAMDTNEDWAEKKEQEKSDSSHLGFINHLSNREKSGWKASQTNFTTGLRGCLHTNQFLTRLESLGVKNK